MKTAPNYYSARCRFGECEECTEGKPPARPVTGLVYLICVCRCHEMAAIREANMRAARKQQR